MSTTITAPASPDTGAGSPYRWRWVVLALVLAAEVMDLLDATIVNVAAPSIRASLSGSYTSIQWIGAGYTLAFAVMLITGGRLGDILGRRRMFIVGAAGFALASTACAFAQNPEMLIGSRIAQGALGAIMIPQGFGILKAVFPPAETAKAFGAFGPVMGLSAVGGPILAGALIDWDLFGTGWRMIFLINIPFAVFAVAGALKFMPEARAPHAPRLDGIGMVLVVLASGLLIYPLVQGRELGWPGWIFAMMGAAVVVFGLFVAYERRRDSSPLIEAGLFAKRAFTGGLAVFVTFFAALIGFMLVFGLFVQIGLGYGPLKAGLASAPLAFGIAIGAVVGHPLTTKLGRRLIHLGLALMILGFVAMYLTVRHWGADVTVWEFIPANMLAGIGMGLAMGPIFGVVLNGVDDHEVGSASGVLNAVQQFGGAVGIAVVGTVFFSLLGTGALAAADQTAGSLRDGLARAGVSAEATGPVVTAFRTCAHDRLTADDPDATPASCTAVETAVRAGVRSPEAGAAAGKALEEAGKATVKRDFTTVMQRTAWITAGMLALTFLLGFLLPKTARPEEG